MWGKACHSSLCTHSVLISAWLHRSIKNSLCIVDDMIAKLDKLIVHVRSGSASETLFVIGWHIICWCKLAGNNMWICVAYHSNPNNMICMLIERDSRVRPHTPLVANFALHGWHGARSWGCSLYGIKTMSICQGILEKGKLTNVLSKHSRSCVSTHANIYARPQQRHNVMYMFCLYSAIRKLIESY